MAAELGWRAARKKQELEDGHTFLQKEMGLHLNAGDCPNLPSLVSRRCVTSAIALRFSFSYLF